MSKTTIFMETKGMDAIIQQMDALPLQIEAARKRAVKKTIARIGAYVIRELARAHDIPAKSFKAKAGRKNNSRYRGRVIKGAGSVWVGHNPIKSGYIGRLREARKFKGAFARKYFFQDAFVAAMNKSSGHRGIWVRKGARRFPIEETTVNLVSAQQVAEKAIDVTAPWFLKTFSSELNFEVNVRGKTK